MALDSLLFYFLYIAMRSHSMLLLKPSLEKMRQLVRKQMQSNRPKFELSSPIPLLGPVNIALICLFFQIHIRYSKSQTTCNEIDGRYINFPWSLTRE